MPLLAPGADSTPIRPLPVRADQRPRGPRAARCIALLLVLVLGMLALFSRPGPAEAARRDYLLMPRSELLSLPTRGKAWEYVLRIAHSTWETPELDDQDNKANVEALAGALVYARTGDSAMRAKARNALVAMIPTYDLSRDGGLGPARQIAGWVLVADFIRLGGADDDAFRGLLRRALTHPIGTHPRWGGSLATCQEDSDNNWGAWCSASRIAAALYLGDSRQLARANRVLRGFLGDRTAWSHFRGQGSESAMLSAATRSWACNDAPDSYVPTNPACGNRSGAFPADAGRSGPYSRLDAMYQSETTAAVVLATELLYRNGYPRAWGFRGALARVARFDASHGAWNLGTVQDHWPWLVNRRLGTSYPTVPARYGRSLGYTDWLYGRHSGGGGGTVATPRPTQPNGPGTEPKRTKNPGATDAPAPTPGSRQAVAEAAGPSAGAGPTSAASPKAAGAGGASGGQAAGPRSESGAVTSTAGVGTGLPVRQLVAGGLLLALSLLAAAVLIRTRARPGPAPARPNAALR